jgi:hypothetical protein
MTPEVHRENETKHDEGKLAHAIGLAYFGDMLFSERFMFDYDDTLVGRGNTFPRASSFNREAIKKIAKAAICTGNSIKAINLRSIDPRWPGEDTASDKITVFADGGINEYEYSLMLTPGNEDDGVQNRLVRCVDTDALFSKKGAYGTENIISLLVESGIARSKIENRGDAMITIKPIHEEYRPIVMSLVAKLLEGGGFVVRSAGRTTIEIAKPNLSKVAAVQSVLDDVSGTITYVGDEFYPGGNDYTIFQLDDKRVRCQHTGGPPETAFFIATLLKKKNPHGF